MGTGFAFAGAFARLSRQLQVLGNGKGRLVTVHYFLRPKDHAHPIPEDRARQVSWSRHLAVGNVADVAFPTPRLGMREIEGSGFGI